jgi:hypothetical protein
MSELLSQEILLKEFRGLSPSSELYPPNDYRLSEKVSANFG